MSRKNLIRSDVHPYHVTTRTNNKEFFPIPLGQVWNHFSSDLLFVSRAYNAKIHAFVLMSNHIHLLLTTPDKNLDVIMKFILENITHSINHESGRINRVFGGRYHWNIIYKNSYFFQAMKYIYQNPIRAGVCNQIENYRYSSFSGLVGNTAIHFPISSPSRCFDNVWDEDFDEQLDLFNERYREDEIDEIKSAFYRSEFKLPKVTKLRAPMKTRI